MLKQRVFPCLLLKDTGLVKTVRFQAPAYIGDPINAVRIFNAREVDELILLDILAQEKRRIPPVDLISKIANECLMPLTVGGGITTLEHIKVLLNAGVEKVSINTAAVLNPLFIKEAANIFGSQSIIVSIDVKKTNNVYEIYIKGGKEKTGLDPVPFARQMQEYGAGEIFLNSIDRDGTMEGYDIELIKSISSCVNIPVIACGGAGGLNDFREAIYDGGASAAVAGSLFVFHGRKKAVLINFPSKKELMDAFR